VVTVVRSSVIGFSVRTEMTSTLPVIVSPGRDVRPLTKRRSALFIECRDAP
jgi:hypothetical protein